MKQFALNSKHTFFVNSARHFPTFCKNTVRKAHYILPFPAIPIPLYIAILYGFGLMPHQLKTTSLDSSAKSLPLSFRLLRQ